MKRRTVSLFAFFIYYLHLLVKVDRAIVMNTLHVIVVFQDIDHLLELFQISIRLGSSLHRRNIFDSRFDKFVSRIGECTVDIGLGRRIRLYVVTVLMGYHIFSAGFKGSFHQSVFVDFVGLLDYYDAFS